MIIKLQKYYEDANLSGAVSSVIFLDIRESCTLKEVHVSVGANVSGANAVFALKKNGSAISGAGVTINIAADENEVTGLSEALAEGDRLDLALSSGAIDSPVILTLTVEVADAGLPIEIGLACSDETTDITTGTAKATFRAPCAFTLTGVRANLNTASSSGTPTVDINVGGSTILSTKLTIDANEKTSVTAATPAVISDDDISDDDEITIDIDTAGTGAKGLKVWLIGVRS